MGNKQTKILNQLLKNNNMSFHEIIDKFSVDKLAVIRFIDTINNTFQQDVIMYNQNDIYMSEEGKILCYKKFVQEKYQLFTYHEVDDRYLITLIEILVGNTYPSLKRLADVSLVSKNTILNDLKKIKEDMKQKGLYLSYSRKNGYSISGSEFMIRNLLVTTIGNILAEPCGKILLVEKEIINEADVFLLRKRLETVESRIGIKLTDQQLEELPYILLLVIKRAKLHQKPWSFKVEKYDIANTVEYPVIQEMFWDYDFLNETDLLYLSMQVLASNMVESALQISDGDEISIATDKFINNIERYLAIRITKRSELKDKVILHMRPAIYRNLLGFQINNPLTEEFILEYHQIYQVVRKSIHPFEEIIHQNLSKEEVVYLSMIVLGWIYQTEETENVFTAVVLCQNGTSISKLLLVTLQSMFPDIDFIGAFSVRQFEQSNEDVDFIFTTVPILNKTTTFLIPSILDKHSRISLKNCVHKEMTNNRPRLGKKLVQSIMDLIPTENVDLVEERIESFFRNPHVGKHVKTENKLFNFSTENISIIEHKAAWEELIDVSMNPLLERKSITQNYVDKTKQGFYANFDQMIIATDVYLPHAHPDYGVNKMDFQIVIFKQPLFTPSGEIVKIIVSLAPDANNEHVPTLIKLNNLFSNTIVINRIMKEKNTLTIKNILNSVGGEGYGLL